MTTKARTFAVLMPVCVCLMLSGCLLKAPEKNGAAFSPAVVYDASAGRFFAVYVKSRYGEVKRWRIAARFIDSSGALTGGELVISESDSEYSCPSLAYDGVHHRFFVLWSVSGSLVARIINADGTPYGESFTVATVAWSGTCPAAAYDDSHDMFLAVWGNCYLYGQLITSAGTVSGAKIILSTNPARDASPALAYDAANQRFFCAWEDSGCGIRGCVIDGNGLSAVPEFLISSSSGLQYRPAVTHDRINSRFLVSWEESDPDTGLYSLKGQVLNSDGAPYSSVVTVSGPSRPVLYHRAEFDPSAGKYFLVFGDTTPGSESIWGEFLTADGSLSGTSGGNIELSYMDYPGDRRPALAYDSEADRYLAVWEYGLIGAHYSDQQRYGDLHSRLVNSDGTPAGDIFILSNGGVW